ncbi:hypothetical protein [Deinococcus sonorensis]|uniref:Uncharacterized protein n=2 Tax=Deinococcus sonorensis TaxID=309891 RepID=A0AAU7U9S7_9DEIO
MTQPDEQQQGGQTPDPSDLDELNSGMAEVRTGDADRVEEPEAGEAHPADDSPGDH